MTDGLLRNPALVLMMIFYAAGMSSAVKADVLEIKSDGVIFVHKADGPDESTASIDGAEIAGVVPQTALTMVQGSTAPLPYSAAVSAEAELNGLSPVLLEAVVWQESRWRPGAVSRAGAIGLTQLMPATARSLNVDPYDPLANLAGGARYLRQQLDRFHGDLEKALAAYNAGPGRVIRYGGVPPISETRAYVAAVIDRLAASPSGLSGAIR